MEHSDPLFQFFGGYFNQDWDVDAPDWQGIVKLYQQDVSRSDQLILASLIRSRMIDSPLSDEDLDRALFHEYGCYYSSQGDGISPREWLDELVNFLEKD